MNKVNRMVAVIAVGLFLPNVNYAEYGDDFGSRATSIVKATGQRLGGVASKDSLGDSVQANLERVQENLKDSQEEADKRKRNAGGTAQLDKLKTALALPDLVVQSALNRRESESKQLSQLFTSLGQGAQPTGPAVEPKENSCKKGVDIAGAKSMTDQLASEPFRYLREQGLSALADADKAAKAKKQENLAKLLKQLEETIDKEDEQKGVDAEAAGTKKSILAGGDEFALKNRIAGLDKTWKKQKNEITESRKALFKTVFELPKRLDAIKEGDKEILKIANQFADSAEKFRQVALQSTQNSAKNLYDNCKANVDQLGGGNPLAPGSLTNAAYQWVVAYHNGDADFFANKTFLNGMNQLSQNLRCSDAADKVDALLGGPLYQKINALRGQTDPKRLLQDSMALVQDISNAQMNVFQDVGSDEAALASLTKDCDYAAKNVKKVEKFIQGVQSQVGQQGQGGAGGNTASTGTSTGARRGNAAGRPAGGSPASRGNRASNTH